MTAHHSRVLTATFVAVFLGFAAAPHASAAVAKQQHFASPEEAVQALVAAAKTGEPKSLLAILGPAAKPLVDSGDPVADREALENFVAGYEEANALEKPSPLGELFAAAKTEGYQKKADDPTPYHGYIYRILDGQGPHATGGAYGYLARGVLLGGFAMIARPASYGVSGVMTFLVNQDGVVFEKDLGLKTAALAQALELFDPDETWKRVPDPEEAPMAATE